jgi:tetratricopeptide (TPR) repeat protein
MTSSRSGPGATDPSRRQSPQDGAEGSSPGPPASPSVAYYLEQADRQYRDHEYEAAIVSYSEAIDADPRNAIAFNNRGIAYFQLGHLDAAIEDFDRAIVLDEKASVIHYNRGNAYLRLGQFDRAIRDYSAAIRIDPSDANAYANRAIAHELRDDQARAASDRAMARRLESGSVPHE